MNVTELLRGRDSTGLGKHLAIEVLKEFGTKSRHVYDFLLPAIDMFEDGNDLVVVVDLAGFSKKDISLRIVDTVLSISAKREPEQHLGTVYSQQRPTQINKKIMLPISVVEDEKVVGTAKFADGVLTLKIPIPKSSNVAIV